MRNLREVLRKVELEGAHVRDGADDVCRGCPYLREEKCEYSVDADDNVRKMDEYALRLLGIEGGYVRFNDIKKRLPEVFSKWYANYCYDCDWLMTCEKKP